MTPRRNRHLEPKTKKKSSKPYVPISSVYESLLPLIKPSSILPIDQSQDYISILEKMTAEELVKNLKSPSLKPSEAQKLLEHLLPHQRRALLEERALHEYSATAADASTGGYDGGGPKAVSSGPAPYDPDALAWFAAVAANGSTITTANKNAFNTAILDMKGLIAGSTNNPNGTNFFSSFAQACFLVGVEGNNALSSIFIPFINTTGVSPINNNFTSSDYNKLIGLSQRGSEISSDNRYIDTQISNNDATNLPRYNRHTLVYVNGLATPPTGVATLGSVYGGGGGNLNRYWACLTGLGSTNLIFRNNGNAIRSVTVLPTSPFYGSFCATTPGSNTFDLYVAGIGVLYSTSIQSSGANAGNLYIGSDNNAGSIGSNILSFYSLGTSLPSDHDSTGQLYLDKILKTLISSLT